ncbi:MAG: sulfate adenylyltransferase subunit CysD [Rhodospirillales bacterium]|nr:sulfate adenylyltransferase subunit CysD [Rhodospirillales bacterium]
MPAPETLTGERLLPAHLARLEAESVHIIREVVAEAKRPVLLYSIGKDSSVLLELARRAFAPARIPFPVLHIDTLWKFGAMIRFRDETARRLGLDLIVHTNEARLNPFEHDTAYYTHAMKTEALKQALTKGAFDAAFGGARRDEEASRAKERIVSVRGAGHDWDPKRQRPEFWKLVNLRTPPGGSVRVFPLSNWTETDIWHYILARNLPVVELYLAARRPVVVRDGTLIVVDDAARMGWRDGERAEERMVRFRSLGCWPHTGAVASEAATLEEVVAETLAARVSERGGRLIDRDPTDSMERKKREGYF